MDHCKRRKLSKTYHEPVGSRPAGPGISVESLKHLDEDSNKRRSSKSSGSHRRRDADGIPAGGTLSRAASMHHDSQNDDFTPREHCRTKRSTKVNKEGQSAADRLTTTRIRYF